VDPPNECPLPDVCEDIHGGLLTLSTAPHDRTPLAPQTQILCWYLEHCTPVQKHYKYSLGCADRCPPPPPPARVFRLWVAPPNERPLPEVYEDIYGGPLTIGNRGGIHVADTQEHIVLEAE
jgi:hypothetical protein